MVDNPWDSNMYDLIVYKKFSEIFWSSRQRCTIKKSVLEICAKFTGKHPCRSLFFNKVAGLVAATLLKKETLAEVFSRQFWKNFKSTFFTEHLWTTTSEFWESLRPLLPLHIHRCMIDPCDNWNILYFLNVWKHDINTWYR